MYLVRGVSAPVLQRLAAVVAFGGGGAWPRAERHESARTKGLLQALTVSRAFAPMRGDAGRTFALAAKRRLLPI